MNQSTFRLQILVIILTLMSIAASPASPGMTTKDYNFDVGATFGDRDTFDFKVPVGGCIIAKITSWSPSGSNKTPASKLALILNGSDRSEYYSRIDGTTTIFVPLWTSYAVKTDQISKVKIWTISVVNFTKSNTAKGILSLEYPPTQTPCELKVAASRTKGQLDLSWVYTGKAFKGSFFIERSTDGKTWNVISSCKKAAPTSDSNSSSYSCSDTGLKSSATYYYRACAVTSGSKCDAKSSITPARSIKAP